jgi:membrane-bound ClpP family serine protease
MNETSFTRWQGRSIEQLGNAISLLLGLSLATIGFIVSKLLDKELHLSNSYSKSVVIIGSFFLLITAILLLIVVYNRLFLFKKTTQIARKRQKNETTNIDTMRSEVKAFRLTCFGYPPFCCR